jgi:hypothetical protein
MAATTWVNTAATSTSAVTITTHFMPHHLNADIIIAIT